MQSIRTSRIAAVFAWVAITCAALAPASGQVAAAERAGSLGVRFSLWLLDQVRKDWQLRGTADSIVVSCLEKIRLTPPEGEFWSDGDSVKKAKLLSLVFSKKPQDNLCNRVLSKLLKGKPEMAKEINQGVRAIQALYGPVKGDVKSDPFFLSMRADFLQAMRSSGADRKLSAANLQKLEANLIDTAGRRMTRDETLVTIGMARKSFANGGETGMAVLSLPELRAQGHVRAEDTKKADELVTALWDGKRPASVNLASPLHLKDPKTGQPRTLSQSVRAPGSFEAPARRLVEASPMLERAGLEWVAKSLPAQVAEGKLGEHAQAVTRAAGRIDWKKGTNSDKWLELSAGSARELLRKELRARLATMAEQPGGGANPELAKLEAGLDRGIDELLGLSGKRTIRGSIGFGGHASFAACIRAAGEGVQAIPARAKCFKGLEKLKEPSIEWLARNFPAPVPGLQPLATAWSKAAARVYGDLKSKKKIPGTEASRLQELMYQGTVESARGYYLQLAERLHGDFVAETYEGPARAPLSETKRAELGALITASVDEMWGRKSPEGALKLVTTPGAAAVTPNDCFKAAGSDLAKIRLCANELQKRSGDRVHAWLLQNFPQGGPKTAFLTDSARKTGNAVYDETGMPRDPSRSEADRMKEIPGRILGEAATAGSAKLKASFNGQRNLAHADQQESRRTDSEALGASIRASAIRNSPAAVEQSVPETADPSNGTATMAIGLAKAGPNGNTGLENMTVNLVSAVESDPAVQRDVVALFGSLVLGVDGDEGRKELVGSPGTELEFAL